MTPFSKNSFFLHKGKERTGFVSEVISAIRLGNPSWGVGGCALLTRGRKAYIKNELELFVSSGASYQVADPDCQRLLLDEDARGAGRKDHAYLQGQAPWNLESLVRDSLQAQIDVGASVLISPWLPHGETGTNNELDMTLCMAREAMNHELTKDKIVLVGFEVTDKVLGNDDARTHLLNQLVEIPRAGVYLRVSTTSPREGRSQYARQPGLSGLRHFVSVLARNDMPTVLPQSGLLGWLMAPHGVIAFGAGTTGSMEWCKPPGTGGGGGGKAPLHWYYLPQFLGFVLAEELPSIADVAGYQPCICPYCVEDPPITGETFNAEVASRHYLWNCSMLANEIRRSANPDQTVRRRLLAAQSFWKQCQQDGLVLDRRSGATHLESWIQVAAG